MVKNDITKIVKEYECVNCQKQFTLSDKGKTIPLTDNRKEINKCLKLLYNKRLKVKKSYS